MGLKEHGVLNTHRARSRTCLRSARTPKCDVFVFGPALRTTRACVSEETQSTTCSQGNISPRWKKKTQLVWADKHRLALSTEVNSTLSSRVCADDDYRTCSARDPEGSPRITYLLLHMRACVRIVSLRPCVRQSRKLAFDPPFIVLLRSCVRDNAGTQKWTRQYWRFKA